MQMVFALLVIATTPEATNAAPHYNSVSAQVVEFQTKELCEAAKAIIVKTAFTHATDCFQVRKQ
jgi:hypothetical protein